MICKYFKKNNWLVFCILFIVSTTSSVFSQQLNDSSIVVEYQGDAKVEVGSPFVGVEFHHSSPVPQRISFYYPVANSIDLSTDYWKRDTTFVSSLRLGINDGKILEIGKEPFLLNLTPYSASFTKVNPDYTIKISYNFSRNNSAVIITYELTNTSSQTNIYDFETKYYLILRTCHTYDYVNNTGTEFSNDKKSLFANYNNIGTDNAQLFIANASEKPNNYELSKEKNSIQIDNRVIEKPFINYVFRKYLAPNGKMIVVQILGTTKQNEGKDVAAYMVRNYQKEIQDYSKYVLNKSIVDGKIKLNDPVMDHSILWAKAILTANSHYLDGSFVPMPCPAEYNFFFTHDVLLTDLAAVNFDLARVKNDLQFIISHADKNKVIPHAYYWKDSTYKTEYADADNWNNYWFIILSAKYLMHSGDITFLRQLYPFINKCLETGLRTKGNDDLIWSNRPDWWDIGRKNGPRVYMTILAIKALQSFNYISASLDLNLDRLKEYERLSEKLNENLNKKLWADDVDYLMNFYSDGTRDEHLYMGSLLAAHYNLLDETRIGKMIETVKAKLLDKVVGVYTVWPMDFNKLLEFWNFAGNEAGEPYFYINGGVWPHANSWYALALSSVDRKAEASAFIKKTMTVKEIMNGPNGQPAMYEVRNGNSNDPKVYGTVDKPQFLWAAGWYLYDLYNIFLEKENNWNLQFSPFLNADQKYADFDYAVNGSNVKVRINGKDKTNSAVSLDGKYFPSFVLPQKMPRVKSINLNIAQGNLPLLISTSSILDKVDYRSNVMTIKLKAFEDHKNKTVLRSSQIPKSILVDGVRIESFYPVSKKGYYEVAFEFVHKSNAVETVEVKF
jgi:glycogen debranching enzyme